MFPQSRSGLFHSLMTIAMLFALLISVAPIGHMFVLFRPEIVCLVVIYWLLQAPLHLGVGFAASVGLFQDVIEGSVWGAHMMALAVVGYVCTVSYQRFKNYSTWHQTIWILVLVGIHQNIVNWVQGMQGYRTDTFILLLSTAVSALFWPLLKVGLGKVQRIYRIT